MKSTLQAVLIAFIILLIIPSCSKQIAKDDGTLLLAPNNITAECKAIGFAAAIRANNGTITWKNLLLKWYDQSGQLKHVKFNFDWFGGTQCCPELAVDYGELIYAGNEIHLRDVYYNDEILRVQLDQMKRPVVSWYDGHGRAGQYQYDTSYYSYSASGRLESIVQHRRFGGSDQTVIQTWNFTYDPDGNLVLITEPGKYGGYEFRYDYTQLDYGMVSLHMLSGPVKALEFMDLLKFEQHHRISAVIVYAESGFPNIVWTYGNFSINSSGQVTTYTPFNDDNIQRFTWYTAWDCNGTQLVQGKNPTQSEFMRMVE